MTTASHPLILYDFDGTITDSLPAMVEIYNRIAAEEGFTIIIVAVTWGLSSEKALTSLRPDAIADHSSYRFLLNSF